MFWWIGILLGTGASVLTNAVARKFDIWSLKAFFIFLPIIIVINYAYWYAYKYAPSFVLAWIYCIAISTILSLSIETFILKEVEFNYKIIMGIFLIIIGSVVVKL